jgi:F-type H+-transporting ATPase subunit gamma
MVAGGSSLDEPREVTDMSARREVEQHLHSLDEIHEVMHSMKTLATMETHKLARFLAIQQRQVADIETMAADLLGHFPAARTAAALSTQAYVLIGSERGFCGDFNDRLVHALPPSGASKKADAILAVGHRLNTRLDERAVPITALDGAGATEQVTNVLDTLAQSIATVQQTHGPMSLIVIYHGNEGGALRERTLFPPFENLPALPRAGLPPQLQLPPSGLYAKLLDQYLFAVLSEVLYTSLMAENQKRVQHLEAALRHLDERREELARRGRALRQEEITEEIEVILLNVDTPGTARHTRRL